MSDLEEALRLAEIGEYLYNRSYSYGDGRTEPREYGIEWQWQQSKPDEFGQGVLLAEAVKWHSHMAEDGITTEAANLRAEITRLQKELDTAREDALEEAAKYHDSLAKIASGFIARQHKQHASRIRNLKDKEVAG